MNDVDLDLCHRLRDLVNQNDMFWKDDVEKRYYNHLCAMMDRIDDSMAYIVSHKDTPKNNDELILFITHTYIIRDSIKKVLGLLGVVYELIVKDLPSCLSDFCNQPPFNNAVRLTDDTIFNYLRSISCAHPLDTENNYITREILQAKHCSPFLLLDRGICREGNVGVHVYSDTSDSSISIQIPYSDLLAYAYSRYSLIKYIIEELSRRLKNKEENWKKRKINRDLSPELILEDIKAVLHERYQSAYDIDELVDLLTCTYTRPENEKYVKLVQKELIQRLPAICDAIDNMDTEAAYQTYKDILYSRPSEMHEGAGYELEKIFCYLTDDTQYIDQIFGKSMAALFSKGFASKWVVMDIDNMSFKEIRMLTRIACFMEKQDQDRKKKDNK